jgi:hypothetical protein
MSLTEITKVNQIEITENNQIQVRTATIILKDDVELTRTFHRHVLSQGDDITNEDSKVITIANAIWV